MRDRRTLAWPQAAGPGTVPTMCHTDCVWAAPGRSLSRPRSPGSRVLDLSVPLLSQGPWLPCSAQRPGWTLRTGLTPCCWESATAVTTVSTAWGLASAILSWSRQGAGSSEEPPVGTCLFFPLAPREALGHPMQPSSGSLEIAGEDQGYRVVSLCALVGHWGWQRPGGSSQAELLAAPRVAPDPVLPLPSVCLSAGPP